MTRLSLGALLLLGLYAAGCPRKAQGPSDDPAQQPGKRLKDAIFTQPLSPQSYHVKVADLPKPYQSPSASKPSHMVPVPQRPVLQVPKGFVVNVFAHGLDHPRWLALTPTGDVLCTETPRQRIRLLRDTDGDGAADVMKLFAGADNGLNSPFGMAFGADSFYLGNTNGVLRFPYKKGQEQLEGLGETIASLPGGGHWTRNLVMSPDGKKLYISVGSGSNVEQEGPPRAAVLVMDPPMQGAATPATFASGLRNPVGLDFHPKTGELYTVVNERDGLGDDLVPDYLTRVQKDEFYGWPYAYLTPSLLEPRRMQNGVSEHPELAARTRTPDVLFQAHSAPLGVRFYTGTTFPKEYQNGAFVAFHGSWNRSNATGYKVVFVPFDDSGRPKGTYQDFLTGFLSDPTTPAAWGRPTGLLVLPDGSLLVTDDENSLIYRIQYGL